MKTREHTSQPPAVASEGPLYKEVRRQILDGVAKGLWAPGDRLPSETELAKRFGVAISTIRAGVGDLCAARVLQRIQGKGTFVSRHDLARQQYYFSSIFDDTGEKAATTREIVSMALVMPTQHIRALLALHARKSQQVVVVNALLRVGHDPAAVMTITLPAWRFPKFRQIRLEQTDENLYALYQRAFGVTVVRMEETIQARVATAKQARALNIAAGDPVMHVDRVSYSFNDVPVEVRQRVFVGMNYHYVYRQEKLA